MFELSIRTASEIKPVALMRLSQVDDVDELLKKHERDDISVEEKLDGWKVQIIKSGGEVCLYSRRGDEKTENFPDLIKALSSALPDGSMVEGELVYWEKNKQDVGKVTSIAGSSPENAREKLKDLSGILKIHLYDALWSKGKNISDKPFFERRKALQSMVKAGDTVQLTKQYPFGEWQKAMNSAVQSGGEGIVLKVKDKPYEYKSIGEKEPKPAGIMYKYKGGGGKEDSDDYVVYDYETGDKGKLKALFGQYHDGKLYHISEISNFSKEDEEKLKKKLKSGMFVIEIGFQERQPGGLRHQKFVRFRDDKKPKDATMHEFHVKNKDNFDEAKKNEVADRPYIDDTGYTFPAEDLIFSKRAALLEDEVLRQLEKLVGPRFLSRPRRIGFVGSVDGDKMFRIMAQLESGGKTHVIGDSGTSFGPTQVHGPYFLSALSRMPNVQSVTGIAPSILKKMSKEWKKQMKAVRRSKIWERVPVDQNAVREYVRKNPRSRVRRTEATFIRGFKPDMVVFEKDGKYVGQKFDADVLSKLGLNMNSPAVQQGIRKIFRTYITDGVAKNTLAQLFMMQVNPQAFLSFKRQFTSRNIRKNKALGNLIENVSRKDFGNKIRGAVKYVTKSGYNTNVPGAYNIYQLIIICNGSGPGRVQQFLYNKKTFGPAHLHYLKSGRFKKVLERVRRQQPDLSPIVNQLLSGIPENRGLAGFGGGAGETRVAFSLSKRADDVFEPIDEGHLEFEEKETTKTYGPKELKYYEVIIENVARVVRENMDVNDDMRGIFAKYYRDRYNSVSAALDRTISEFIRGNIDELEQMDMLQILSRYFQKYWGLNLNIEETPKETRKEPEERGEEFWEGAQKEWEEAGPTKKIGALSKRAQYTEPGVLYFPGSYANDIKEGKRNMTIRANDVPISVSEIVKCLTYSGSHICDVVITSKERMSLNRVEKAFGKRVAGALERKFGTNRRFMVIRFDKYEGVNYADDDGEDESKMSEVLIDKDGVKLTRGQIKKHYMKPAVRKKIMSRIKDKPSLIYIGVGENQNILKRNHAGKQIVITNDDPGKNDSPSNYFYWVKRRLLSIHEVFGPKTNLGFVDLDLHGDFSPEEAKKYAKELSGKIKSEFDVTPITYQSGGIGLHVEFTFGEEKNINKLRADLKDLLDEMNEDWDDVTTSIVKGSGMRSDISTLHNKGSIRAPGSLGEIYGKEKKPISGSQDTDDYPDSTSYGRKYSDTPESLDSNPNSLDTGAIRSLPNLNVAPTEGVGTYNIALSKRELVKKGIGEYNPDILKEYIWVWDPYYERLLTHLNISDGEQVDDARSHMMLADEHDVWLGAKGIMRGYVYFFKEKNEGEVHLYRGEPDDMSRKLRQALAKLTKGEAKQMKEMDVPKGATGELWKAQDKQRQLREHMERRKMMGYTEPDPEFVKMLNIKFAKLRKKKILMLIAPNEFCEPEYSVPRSLLVDKFGFDVTTTSSNPQAKGDRGTVIQVDKTATEIDAADYDGFFVVGGKGMVEYSKNKDAQKLLKTFIRQKKPVAMICYAPLLAAETGVVRGRGVTGWPEIMGKIRRANGKWTGMPIEKDRALFTAIGPDDAENLAWVFANFLLNRKTLGPAQEKYLAWKNAAKRLGTIWKVAGMLEEELEEGLRGFSEEEEDELIGGTAEEWLRQHDPTYKEEEEPIEILKKKEEEPEAKPKKKGKKEKLEKKEEKPEEKAKLKPPKKTIFEQIEGEIPSEFKKKIKPIEKAKRPRMEFVEEEELIEDEANFMREMAQALSGEPIAVEPEKPEEAGEEPADAEEKIEQAITPEIVEKATSAVNEECETEGTKRIKELLPLSAQELADYIIDEGEEEKIENESIKTYNNMLAKKIRELAGAAMMSALKPDYLPSKQIQKIVESLVDKYQQQKEIKEREISEEKTGRNDEDVSHGEQFAFDDMRAMSSEERLGAKPDFTDKLLPFTDKEGRVLDSWPKIKMPMLPVETAEYFEPNRIINGIGLRNVFSDERAWDMLKKYPQLLQQWILPNITMAIGYKWFEINSIKEYVGKRTDKERGVTFRHLQGGAPFSMLEEVLNPDLIKKLQDGEIEISDLPGAREYIQHINRLIPEFLNVYLSKENALIPIDSYIYTSLNNEMIKIIGEKKNYSQERNPVCAICKLESVPEFALEKMQRVGRGRWSCTACKAKVAQLESEKESARRELQRVNRTATGISKDLNRARGRLEPDIPEDEKLKEIQLIEGLQTRFASIRIKQKDIEKEMADIDKKKHLYEAQAFSVPFFHTLCPSQKCKLRKIPLTAVDWEDSIWNTDEGRGYIKMLKKEFNIMPPTEMFVEQEADEPTEKELAEIYHIPKKIRVGGGRSWILNVPFKCPYDGIKFRMKDVRGQGYRNMAGFFYYPWETATWEPRGEKDKKKIEAEPQYNPENKGPELQELEQFSEFAVGGAQQQYYEFYNYLRHMDIAIKSGKKIGDSFEIDDKTYTIPKLTARQKRVFAREATLFKTVADFSVEDTQSYLYWLSGSLIINRPIAVDGKLVRSNVLKKTLGYKDRAEQIYIPLLHKWVDHMMKFPNYMKRFNLNEWLVQVGEKQPDGTYSREGIMSDGPGTYFIGKVRNDVGGEKSDIYGFSCDLKSQRGKGPEPKILKILDMWALEDGEIGAFGLNPDQKRGGDFVSKRTAERIIAAKERDNIVGDIKSYDFRNIKVDGERSRLSPDTFVLVRAFIMPGNPMHTPLERIRDVMRNSKQFDFWEKFAALVKATAEDPKYWKEFKEKVKGQKPYLFELENMMDRELFRIKGRGQFADDKSDVLYHYAPKGIPVAQSGLKSPDALIDTEYEKDLVENHGDRAASSLDKKDITGKDVLEYLEKFRGPGGSRMVSALFEPIPADSSKEFKDYVAGHDLYIIDYGKALKDGIITGARIVEGKKSKKEEIEPEDLIREFSEEESPSWKTSGDKLFSKKPHAMIELKKGVLPPKYIKKAGVKNAFQLSVREADSLSTYKKKRKFDDTPEPEGKEEGKNKHRFVIQRHFAEKAGEHFDLRLENDEGAMSSWAIPKHKLPKGKEKLLAMKTEDHPVSYNKFEGEIPKGEYGAGKVETYDKGTYEEIESSGSKIVFKLKGKKEKGTYNIFKTDGKKWMIMENKKEASFYLSKRAGQTYTDGDRAYSVDMLIEITADNKVEEVPVNTLEWNIKEKVWGNGKETSPEEVLENPKKHKDEAKSIEEAELKYPILVYKGEIVDGYHRLAKAISQNKKKIKVIVITDKQLDAARIDEERIKELSAISKRAMELSEEEIKHVLLQSAVERRKMNTIMRRERRKLKELGLDPICVSSTAARINVPGVSDIDFQIGTDDVPGTCKLLEAQGFQFTKEFPGAFIEYTYKTAEGVDVDLKVRPKSHVKWQIEGLKRILDAPQDERDRQIIEKYKTLKLGDKDAYKKVKYDLYRKYLLHPPGDDWSLTEQEVMDSFLADY